MWLRDNCPCPGCRHPRNGPKLLDITDVPADVAVSSVAESADAVTVTFSPDGHRSTFSRDWLDTRRAATGGDGRRRR